MPYHVIIAGVYPPIHAMACATVELASAGLAYLEDQFPHLTEECFHIWPDGALFGEAPSGFVRDSVQAYITTGNGYTRPEPGTVTIGTGYPHS